MARHCGKRIHRLGKEQGKLTGLCGNFSIEHGTVTRRYGGVSSPACEASAESWSPRSESHRDPQSLQLCMWRSDKCRAPSQRSKSVLRLQLPAAPAQAMSRMVPCQVQPWVPVHRKSELDSLAFPCKALRSRWSRPGPRTLRELCSALSPGTTSVLSIHASCRCSVGKTRA